MTCSLARLIVVSFFLHLGIAVAYAEETVTVHLDLERWVGGVSEFDRSKFIVLHSDLSPHDWEGEEDKLDYLLRDLDVYFGRDNGSNVWYYNQSREDPSRPGYVDPEYMATEGARVRTEIYGEDLAHYHQYEDKVDLMIGALPAPHWPGHMTKPCCGKTPWGPTTAEGSGEYMGRYLQEFFRDPEEDSTQGRKRPRFVEVMNEPLYELVTVGEHTPLEVFEYHNVVAEEIRKIDSDVLIGGYTTAFPYFDQRGFERWHERYKLFMDTAAENMDFYSLHFYDFDQHGQPGGGYKGPWNFKGSRIEATLDMVEQYGAMRLGEVKPMLISEYGSRDHRLEQQDWSRERDWVFVKSFSPLMMTFMERPHLILKAIPFILVKAEWSDTIYDWRLMRQKKELEGESGEEWVFTDLVKLYELWSDVNGTRVYSESSDSDLLTDVYVDSEKAYLIVSNLEVGPKSISLDLEGADGNPVQAIRVKHLHPVDGVTTLTETVLSEGEGFEMGRESTAIFEYTFANPVSMENRLEERKYYSDVYLQEIEANEFSVFTVKNVVRGKFGYAVVRIGLGRDHGKSLNPLVRFNGIDIRVPEDFSGDDQSTRANFFGMLEVEVPSYMIEETNRVEIMFPDTGGFVSTVTLEVYDSSKAIRSLETAGSFWGTELTYDGLGVLIGHGKPNATFGVLETTDLSSEWRSSGTVGVFDSEGGARFVEALESQAQFFSVVDCPECLPPPGPAKVLEVSHAELDLVVGGAFQLEAAIGPVNTIDRSLIWESSDDSIATVNSEGLVEALMEGSCEIYVRNERSGLSDACQLKVYLGIGSTGIEFDDESLYKNTDYKVGETIEVTCFYNAGEGATVNSNRDGVAVLLRELRSDWSVVKDVTQSDSRAIGQSKGVAQVSIPLDGVTATADLPSGNFYYLFAIFAASDGETYSKGISPIRILE